MKRTLVSLNQEGILCTIGVATGSGGGKPWPFPFTSYTPSPLAEVKSVPLNAWSHVELQCAREGVGGVGRWVTVYGNQEIPHTR